jgi:regulator of protease activity HflC (stomatin/prohibitin superfamily)
MAMEAESPSAAPRDVAGLPGSPVRDPAQESLVRALRASFNVLRVLIVVLAVLYLLSGLFRVDPGQQGLVARLGKLRTTRGPAGETPVFAQGWHAALPDPFERKFLLTNRVQELKIVTFMFNHPQNKTAKDLSQIVMEVRELTPGVDGAMLTGDRNLSHGRWEVQYRIDNAALFVQNVGQSPADFEPLLQRLTETAVVREVAGRTIEEVTRTALDSVRQGVREKLQRALDELETGVQVVQVVAYTIEPAAVRQAFMDVIRAENERLSLQQKAEEEAGETLNRAAGDKYPALLDLIGKYGDTQLAGASAAELHDRLADIDALLDQAKRDGAGQVAVKLSEAEAKANQINETLRSEYKQFTDYREQYQSQPRIALLNLWIAMRDEILSNKQNEIVFVPDTREIEIHVKSDVERSRELQEEELRNRQKGQKP